MFCKDKCIIAQGYVKVNDCLYMERVSAVYLCVGSLDLVDGKCSFEKMPFLQNKKGDSPMISLVRNVIYHYNDLVAENQLCQSWFSKFRNEELKAKATELRIKLSIVNAWFELLSYDEKFVIQKHLVDKIEWSRIAFEYRERWKNEFYRTERSLQIYQANGLAKIATFAEKHKEITLYCFSEFLCDSTNILPDEKLKGNEHSS